MTIYYDTKTGNVERFVKQLENICPEWKFVNINDFEHFTEPGHFITYTWARGSVPVTSQYFIERYSNLIQSVSSSGNLNWGQTFGMAAEEISKKIGCPIIHKFELSGLKQDVNIVANTIRMMERQSSKKKVKISI